MTDRGRRNLIIWTVILSIPLILIMLIWFGLNSIFGSAGDARAMRNLDRVDLYAQLNTSPAQLDHIIFEDGDDGWFAIPSPQTAEGKSIGFYGTRFADSFLGGTHAPLYCGDAGKVVWAIQDNAIRASLAFCRKRRMDLAELRPIAQPVKIVESNHSHAGVLALRDHIDATPELFGITIPDSFAEYDHTFKITAPYIWKKWDDPTYQYVDWENEISDVIRQEFPALENQYTVSLLTHSAPDLTIFRANDAGESIVPDMSGPAIQRDGQTYLLTDIDRIEQIVITMGCDKATCHSLRNLDLSGVFAESRDLARINAALENTVLMPERATEPRMPTEAALRQENAVIGDVIETTYATKHAELLP